MADAVRDDRPPTTQPPGRRASRDGGSASAAAPTATAREPARGPGSDATGADPATWIARCVGGLVADRRTSSGGRPVVVAVDGRSGAGKTTLASGLVTALAEQAEITATRVTLEGFYRGWDGLASGASLWAAHALPPLSEGRAVRYRPWDWYADREGTPVTLSPGPAVVAEGVGSGVRRARPRIDVLVWVEAPVEVRRARSIGRGDGMTDATWGPWAAQEDVLFAADPVVSEADAVVDTSTPDRVRWRVREPLVPWLDGVRP